LIILGLIGDPKAMRASPADIASEWDVGWYHNSAAALVVDGQLVAAIEEERLTRRKNSGKFPFASIAFCLRQASLSLADIDRVAFGEEGGIGEFRDTSISAARVAELLCAQFGHVASMSNRVRLVDHHISHAWSALGPSGMEAPLVFTGDGFGDGRSSTLWRGQGGRLGQLIATLCVEDSLGRFYASVLGFLGYGRGDEYKVMGLAPYGDPARCAQFFNEHLRLLPGGLISTDAQDSRIVSRWLEDAIGRPRREDEPIDQQHRDVAAGVQAAFERALFHILDHHRGDTHELCMAGGIAQNSVANGKLLSTGRFERVFVQPAAHDAGISLGAALAVADAEREPKWKGRQRGFYGPGLPESLESVLSRWSALITLERCDDVVETAALRLAAGDVIGWVQERSEFGPRALGHRSILADPRSADMKDRINRAVKMREPYRPFAPMVLAERAYEWFRMPVGQESLPFMTVVVDVLPRAKEILLATTHVDGTARVQTVDEELCPRMWGLLRAFERHTGVPVLLNTSLNNAWEPLVDSPDDALACLLTTDISALFVGDWVCVARPGIVRKLTNHSARLVDDVISARYPTRSAGKRGPLVDALLRKSLKPIPVSAVARAILEADSPGSVVSTAADLGVSFDIETLGRELLALWNARLIRITPVTD
jgi:carbamoyltransferase